LVTLLALAVIVAQDISASSLAGSVVDASTLRPLQGAIVILHAAPAGLMRSGGLGHGSGLVQQRSTTTDLAGNYQFGRIGAGDYRIHVQALGYRTTSIDVRVAGKDAAQLSIGLHVDPIALQPVEANASGGTSAHVTAARFDSDLRLDLERVRQQLFAASDVRVVTAFDIAESVSLAEPDVFRAFQRLPGVSTRDDFTTELWTRGAPMDQTAIYFDGIPLFNPLHASGAFSAINPDAIGAAFFHPGVQPTELATAGAGVIDLRTRRGTPRMQGAAELSIISGKLTLMGGAPDGASSWLVAGRRTHIDVLTGEPYNFSDLTMRWDVTLSPLWRIEASGLMEADRLKGDVASIVTATDARWGNRAARITAARRTSRGELRHTVGWSGFTANSDPMEERPPFVCCPEDGYYPMFGEYRGQLVDNAVEYFTAGTTLESVNERGNAHTGSGLHIIAQQARFETQGVWPQRTSTIPLRSADKLLYLTAWRDHSWQVTPTVNAEAGLRVEAGTSFLHAAPRVAVRARITDATSVSFAAGRTYQHAQSIAPVGLGNNVVAMSNLFWVLNGDSVPVLRSTIGTIGIEHWLTRSVLFSATLYERSVRGMIVPEPGPQWLMDRPLFTVASNRAHGADFTVRKLGGRVTTAFSYSYGDSEIRAGYVRYPSPWSRRHSFDATTTVSASESFTLGAAFTAASGAAFTRYDSALRNCRTSDPRACTFMLYAREAGAEIAPGYTSLDVMVDWRGRIGRWDWGAYAQLQNALGNRNAAAYQWSQVTCDCGVNGEPPIVNPDPTRTLPANSQFLRGLPMLPMLGLRVAF
jgi:hypothetical protein